MLKYAYLLNGRNASILHFNLFNDGFICIEYKIKFIEYEIL